MIQKITRKSSKINPKSMEIEAWTGLGGSWGRLGSHLGSQGRQKQKPDDQKMTASGLPFWGPFPTLSVIFQCFLRSFSSLHFDGYQDRFFMDFDQLFGSFLAIFFTNFRIVGKYGKCHSDIVFTMI